MFRYGSFYLQSLGVLKVNQPETIVLSIKFTVGRYSNA